SDRPAVAAEIPIAPLWQRWGGRSAPDGRALRTPIASDAPRRAFWMLHGHRSALGDRGPFEPGAPLPCGWRAGSRRLPLECGRQCGGASLHTLSRAPLRRARPRRGLALGAAYSLAGKTHLGENAARLGSF